MNDKYQKHQLLFLNLIRQHAYKEFELRDHQSYIHKVRNCSRCFFAGIYTNYSNKFPLMPKGGNSCVFGCFLQNLARSLEPPITE